MRFTRVKELQEVNDLSASIEQITNDIIKFTTVETFSTELSIISHMTHNRMFATDIINLIKDIESKYDVSYKTLFVHNSTRTYIECLLDINKKLETVDYTYHNIAQEMKIKESRVSVGDKIILNAICQHVFSPVQYQTALLNKTGKIYQTVFKTANKYLMKTIIAQKIDELYNSSINPLVNHNELVKRVKDVQLALNQSINTDGSYVNVSDTNTVIELLKKQKINGLKLNLDVLNKYTKSGVERGSLVVPIASAGAGKSLFLCDMACKTLTTGGNVLYITLELSTSKIIERIYSHKHKINMNDVTSEDLYKLENEFVKNNPNYGHLDILEFSPNSVTVDELRQHIDELLLRHRLNNEEFNYNIICVDYIGLIKSDMPKDTNTYEKLKEISVQLRGLAKDYQTVILSPAQTNRKDKYYGNTNLGLNNIADSMGIAHTSDMVITLEYLNNNTFNVGIVKNRFGQIVEDLRCKVNFETMTLIDI